MYVRHQSQTLQKGSGALCQPISPLVGEMPGRAEGGCLATPSKNKIPRLPIKNPGTGPGLAMKAKSIILSR
jgi:hypothetical protein